MNRVRGVNTCTNTRRRGARVKPWRAVAALLHSPGSMTTSVHDLGKLHLDRDTPPGVRRAFRRSLILAAVAAGLIAAAVLVVRRGSAVPVQTVVVTPLDAGAGAAQADARARAAAARIEAAEAALRFAQASLENTLIRAPFSGTVLRKEAEVGEVVAPSVGGGLTRGAVVTMADLRTLEVEVDVNEAYIARVHHGQPAKITLDAYPDTSFGGQVRQVVPTADRQRATVQVKVSILDHDPRILPEMGARVDFLEPERPAAARGAAPPAPLRIRVPAGAVRERDGQTVVWLVRNGRLEPRVVQAGPVSGEFREIRSGLSGGELLLVGGVESPQAGLRVRATP